MQLFFRAMSYVQSSDYFICRNFRFFSPSLPIMMWEESCQYFPKLQTPATPNFFTTSYTLVSFHQCQVKIPELLSVCLLLPSPCGQQYKEVNHHNFQESEDNKVKCLLSNPIDQTNLKKNVTCWFCIYLS